MDLFHALANVSGSVALDYAEILVTDKNKGCTNACAALKFVLCSLSESDRDRLTTVFCNLIPVGEDEKDSAETIKLRTLHKGLDHRQLDRLAFVISLFITSGPKFRKSVTAFAGTNQADNDLLSIAPIKEIDNDILTEVARLFHRGELEESHINALKDVLGTITASLKSECLGQPVKTLIARLDGFKNDEDKQKIATSLLRIIAYGAGGRPLQILVLLLERLSSEKRATMIREINATVKTNVATQPAPVSQGMIEDLGFFEPDLRVDNTHPEGDIITVDKNIICRNVDAFCDRIDDAIRTNPIEKVRCSLHLNLRGAASRWYAIEVGKDLKNKMSTDPEIDLSLWKIALTEKFRPRKVKAVRENNEMTFGVDDVHAGRSITAYFYTKLLRARAAGFRDHFDQLIQVYISIDARLRRDIPEPDLNTTITEFRGRLEEKEEVWQEIYRNVK